MKVAVTASGQDLDAQVSTVFGRCPAFVVVDTESMSYQGYPNQAVSASGGAGVQAAQFVVGLGAGALISGHVGPNAFEVFHAANVPVYTFEGTVRQAVEAYRAGQLTAETGATARDHSGLGRNRRTQ